MPTRIVTYAHRPKRPPRKRKTVAVAVPAVVRQRARADATPLRPAEDPTPANDDSETGKPGIVTIRRKSRFGEVPDVTPEEHQRRGDAADELFREIVRKIRE